MVADEQALRGSAVELGDPFDNALEISAHRVGKPGPRWTEAAHRADANVTSLVLCGDPLAGWGRNTQV